MVRKKLTFNFVFSVMSVLMVLASPLAGWGSNVWNVDGSEETEKASRAVGASFLKASGKIILMLGLAQERQFEQARNILKQAKGDLDTTVNMWPEASKLALQDNVVIQRLKAVSARPEQKKTEYFSLGAVPEQDSVWPKVMPVAKTGRLEQVFDLFGQSIKEINDALKEVETAIQRDSAPSQLSVWRLMNAIEQSLLRSRYFTILFTR